MGRSPAGSTYRYCPELKNPIIIHYNSQFYLFGDGFEAFYTSPSGRDWEKANKKFSFPHQTRSQAILRAACAVSYHYVSEAYTVYHALQ